MNRRRERRGRRASHRRTVTSRILRSPFPYQDCQSHLAQRAAMARPWHMPRPPPRIPSRRPPLSSACRDERRLRRLYSHFPIECRSRVRRLRTVVPLAYRPTSLLDRRINRPRELTARRRRALLSPRPRTRSPWPRRPAWEAKGRRSGERIRRPRLDQQSLPPLEGRRSDWDVEGELRRWMARRSRPFRPHLSRPGGLRLRRPDGAVSVGSSACRLASDKNPSRPSLARARRSHLGNVRLSRTHSPSLEKPWSSRNGRRMTRPASTSAGWKRPSVGVRSRAYSPSPAMPSRRPCSEVTCVHSPSLRIRWTWPSGNS